MTAGIIFGQLQSFGGLSFTGGGSPVYPVQTGWPLEMQADYETSLVQVGHPFLYDAQGLEPAPLKDAVMTYDIILQATAGLNDQAALADLRRRYDLIWAAIQGTYTWGAITGVSGQKGLLTVAHEQGSGVHTYTATARLLSPPNFQLVKGQPTYMAVMLKFGLLSEFTQV